MHHSICQLKTESNFIVSKFKDAFQVIKITRLHGQPRIKVNLLTSLEYRGHDFNHEPGYQTMKFKHHVLYIDMNNLLPEDFKLSKTLNFRIHYLHLLDTSTPFLPYWNRFLFP